MKCVYGIVILIVLVLASGCTGSTSEKDTAVQTASAPAVTTVTGTPVTGTPLAELSRARPNASVKLEHGAVVLTFTADGPQAMTFGITEGAETIYGESDDLVMTGPYTGSLVFGPPDTAEYQLNITGNGTWTAELTRPDTTRPLSVPVNLTGTGAEVSPAFVLEKGEYIFARDEVGLASPLYELRYANGSVVMDANNTCVLPCLGEGSMHPFAIMAIPVNGSYLVSAIPRSSPHPWNVTISAVPAVPQMGPGPALPQNP
ncbi:hypothetical protein [Methanoregula sp. UBA64]|jgi:hypothetical protein|uniref:hypothetical protein n=1 Tax=Methanoregula sp. UBA64 TaxID=1915554 RepID=UPI0025EA81CC|nr:hypothetical protein [Methanoregula sp. UBA64]